MESYPRTVIFLVLLLLTCVASANSTYVYHDSHGFAVLASRKRPSQGHEQRERFIEIVDEAAAETLVDPALLSAIITVESSWNPSALSSKGAMGLMQLMPQTAQNWGVTNALNPRQNIFAGARYFKHLIMLFDRNITLALAAYHAGEDRIIKDGKIPDIPETQQYVKSVTQTYHSLIKR